MNIIREAILQAYKKLDIEEQEDMKHLADTLVSKIKGHNTKLQINRAGALELLGSIGMHMIETSEFKCPVCGRIQCGRIQHNILSCSCIYRKE